MQQEQTMSNEVSITDEESKVIEQVKELKGFYSHLMTYVFVVSGLTILNWFTTDYWWVLWVILGWGIGIVSHAMEVFELMPFLGADWEKKEVEKRLGRKL